jgi:hypothetical protein
MVTNEQFSSLLTLGTALEQAPDTGETGTNSPLHQARRFLLNHLSLEESRPYRADDLLELLTPSEHVHHSWEQERALILEGLTMLHQLWRPQLAASAAPLVSTPASASATRRPRIRIDKKQR